MPETIKQCAARLRLLPLTYLEAAATLGVSYAQIAHLVSIGRLHSFKYKRNVKRYITLGEIDEYWLKTHA